MGTRGPMYGGMGGLAAGAGADPAPVTPPAATSEAVAADGAPAAKTFGAFTDPDGRIASYSAAITNAVGSTAIASGSGLGSYAVSGYANGDSYAIRLTALDASGDPLATAVHVVDIAVPSYSALTPAAAPADQSLTAGTTSSGTITWGTPTGGSGSVSLAVTLDLVRGGGTAALSGSGSSRTVTGLADGDVVLARGVWTDAVTGDIVEQAVAVAVAASSGASWAELADIDFSTADPLAGVNSGTLAVTTDSGATPVCSIAVVANAAASSTVAIVSGEGIVATSIGGGGRITGGVDLAALLSLTAQQMLAGILAVQLVYTGIDNDATADSIRAAVGVSADAGDSAAKGGIRFLRATASTSTPHVILNGTSTAYESAISTPTEMVITIYVVAGHLVAVRYTAGITTLPTPSLTDLGTGAQYVGIAAASNSTTPTGLPLMDGDPLYAMVSSAGVAVVKCPRIRIYRYG